MKGIIFCNDTDNAHEILLALRFTIVDIISQTCYNCTRCHVGHILEKRELCMSKSYILRKNQVLPRNSAKALHLDFSRKDGYLEATEAVVTWCVVIW